MQGFQELLVLLVLILVFLVHVLAHLGFNFVVKHATHNLSAHQLVPRHGGKRNLDRVDFKVSNNEKLTFAVVRSQFCHQVTQGQERAREFVDILGALRSSVQLTRDSCVSQN